MALSETIESEIVKRFGEADWEVVRALLGECGDERLQISILRLSRGKVARVEDLVQAAKRDYRDVLAWASQPMRTYIVGLLRKGPQWAVEDEGGRTHLHYESLRQWKEAGAIVVGGWFKDFDKAPGEIRGLYIFTLDSVEEAQALVQADPAVRAGKLEFEFHPWWTRDGLKIARSDEL